jgi:hypothetical protein
MIHGNVYGTVVYGQRKYHEVLFFYLGGLGARGLYGTLLSWMVGDGRRGRRWRTSWEVVMTEQLLRRTVPSRADFRSLSPTLRSASRALSLTVAQTTEKQPQSALSPSKPPACVACPTLNSGK